MASNLQSMLPKIMEQMGADAMGGAFGSAPAIPFSPFSDATEEPQPETSVNIGELVKLPPSCSNIVNQVSDFEWAGIGSCAKDALQVSEECVDCVPQFGKQLQEKCAETCESVMSEVADSLESSLATVEGKMQKTMMRSFGGMPSQSDLRDVMGDAQEVLSSSTMKLVPCAECVAPKFVTFAGCMLGEAAANSTEDLSKELCDLLKSGDLLRVEVGPAPMGDEEQ